MSDPVALLQGLRQPDPRSCGASVLVAARMLTDSSYAAWMTPERFADEALGTHRRVTARQLRGRLQVPWPRALGTPPWSMARELGPDHVTRLARLDPGPHFDRVLARVNAGHVSALYVGNGWCPRHVVLAVPGPEAGILSVYEPATAQVLPLDRRSALEHRLRLAGWDRLWFVVHPR